MYVVSQNMEEKFFYKRLMLLLCSNSFQEMKATAKLKRGKRALKKAIHAKQQLEEETKKPRRFLTPYGFYLKENFGKVQKLV